MNSLISHGSLNCAIRQFSADLLITLLNQNKKTLNLWENEAIVGISILGNPGDKTFVIQFHTDFDVEQ